MRNNEERQTIMEEKQEAFQRHQEMLLQLEMDADREIEELKEMCTAGEESDSCVRCSWCISGCAVLPSLLSAMYVPGGVRH